MPYVPVDIDFSGFDTNAVGALPTPKMKMSNTNGVFQALVNEFGDLVGCNVSRLRVYAENLDAGSSPNPNRFYGPDLFRVEQKTDENAVYIEWELSANIDQEGKELPGRVVIRDTCLWRYRFFQADSATFDYARAQCPYVGTRYYDENDNEVADPAKDKPSRRLTCCERRFGENSPLPFGGFPGTAKMKS